MDNFGIDLYQKGDYIGWMGDPKEVTRLNGYWKVGIGCPNTSWATIFAEQIEWTCEEEARKCNDEKFVN